MVAVGGTPTAPVSPPPLPAPPPLLTSQAGYEDTTQILSSLISRSGVSGAEGPVREHIRALLPAWVQPHMDAKGNLWVTFGSGTEHVVFVAHMDEVGFQVVSIGADGRLLVQPRGGLYTSMGGAGRAGAHGTRGCASRVEPRRDWHTAAQRTPPGQLTVFIGATSRQAAEALGVQIGQTVTMPKHGDSVGIACWRAAWMIVLAVPPCSSPCATSIATLYRDVSPSPGSSRKRLAWLAHVLSLLPPARRDACLCRRYLCVVGRAARVATFGLCASGAGGGAPGDGQWHGGAAPSHRCRARAGTVAWYPTPVWHDGRVERRCVVCSQRRGQCAALVAWTLLPFASRGGGSARHRSAGATHRQLAGQ